MLETRQFTRLGGHQAITVDLRVIAATNRDPWQQAQAQRFREDLYWRLAVMTIMLPPLRDRTEDILPLAEYFLEALGVKLGHAVKLTARASQKLMGYHYPGNVRELRNLLWRAAAPCGGERIDAEHIIESDPRVEQAFEIRQTIERMGSLKAAARKLGVSRKTLYKKLKRCEV